MATILVIDDDEQLQEYLRTLLEQEGHCVRQARDGEKGVRKYRDGSVDLVLCDIFMDRQEGLATIRQLIGEFPDVKIVAMSGGSNLFRGGFLYEAGQFGAAAALHKPLERELLLDTVKVLLQT
jgi:DNA-binding NtrC family response regulator